MPSFADELVELLGNDEVWEFDKARHVAIHCSGVELLLDVDGEVSVLHPVPHNFGWWEHGRVRKAVLHLLAVKMRKAASNQAEFEAAVVRFNGEGSFRVVNHDN
jgi:hypothetical protein